MMTLAPSGVSRVGFPVLNLCCRCSGGTLSLLLRSSWTVQYLASFTWRWSLKYPGLKAISPSLQEWLSVLSLPWTLSWLAKWISWRFLLITITTLWRQVFLCSFKCHFTWAYIRTCLREAAPSLHRGHDGTSTCFYVVPGWLKMAVSVVVLTSQGERKDLFFSC